MPVLVDFQGERYVYLGEDLADLGPAGHALAYPDHCDAEGHVRAESALSDSFAHVMPSGEIKRYLKVIGHVSDLRPVGPAN